MLYVHFGPLAHLYEQPTVEKGIVKHPAFVVEVLGTPFTTTLYGHITVTSFNARFLHGHTTVHSKLNKSRIVLYF